jgi:hypothetical protein
MTGISFNSSTRLQLPSTLLWNDPHDLHYAPTDLWERPDPPAGKVKYPSSYSIPKMFPEEKKKWETKQAKLAAAKAARAREKLRVKSPKEAEAGTSKLVAMVKEEEGKTFTRGSAPCLKLYACG